MPDLLVVGGALVRVLAVGEVEHLLERGHEVVAGSRPRARRTSARSRRRSARWRRTPRSRATRASAPTATPPVSLQLLDHGVVALRPHDHADERVVLGGGADQRRAADVDVLDHLLLGDAAARGRALERIEVHARRGRSARCRARRASRGAPRVERTASRPAKIDGCSVLTRPSRISGKPGVVLDRARRRCRLRRARAAVPPVETISTPSSVSARAKSTRPRLSKTRQQRALDLQVARITPGAATPPLGLASAHRRSRTPLVHEHEAGVVGVERDTRPRAIRRIARGRSSCSRAVQDRQDLLLASRV